MRLFRGGTRCPHQKFPGWSFLIYFFLKVISLPAISPNFLAMKNPVPKVWTKLTTAPGLGHYMASKRMRSRLNMPKYIIWMRVFMRSMRYEVASPPTEASESPVKMLRRITLPALPMIQ